MANANSLRGKAGGLYFLGGRLILIAIMAVFLSAAGCEEEPISPPSGEYPGSIAVTFNFPGADEIWYTLDGSEPTSKCLQYNEGDLLLVDTTTVVKARAVTYGASVTYSDVASVTYQFASDGGGGSDDSTNGLAASAWLEYETQTRQIFADKYFGGCEPIVGCGGGLDLGQLGIYYICDADSTITDPNACTSAGGGWISWDVVQEGLGGGSTFTYNNFNYQLASGEMLSATGAIVGHFDSGGSGTTGTAEGETIRLSGAYTADIDDAVSVTNRQKTGGSYFVSCSMDGCADTGLTYVVSSGPTLELLPPSAASCDAGPAFIRIQQGSECLSPSDKGPFADLLACNGDLTGQQWDIVENTDSAEPEDFFIQLKEGSGCLSAKPVDGGPSLYYEVASCIGNDPSQVFSFTKSEGEVGKSARIVASPNAFTGHPEALCLAALSPFAKLVTANDCSDPSKDFDFNFVIGNTFPEQQLDPTTDLLAPLAPVTFILTDRGGDNGQSSVAIASSLHDNLVMTVTAENNDGHAKKIGATNLEGFGVYTSGANLKGIQTNEQLILTFDQPVDISNLTFRQWEGPDQIKVRWSGENFVITDESDIWSSVESVDVDMKGVTWIALKGDSFLTVAYLKSITVTPTVR